MIRECRKDFKTWVSLNLSLFQVQQGNLRWLKMQFGSTCHKYQCELTPARLPLHSKELRGAAGDEHHPGVWWGGEAVLMSQAGEQC